MPKSERKVAAPANRSLRRARTARPPTKQAASRQQDFHNIEPILSSRLLSLPRELRDQIWDPLWLHSQHLLVQFQTHQFHVKYDQGRHLTGMTNTPGNLPSWLRTSKQILAEGIDQFQRNSRWEFHSNNLVDPIPGKGNYTITKQLLSPFDGNTLCYLYCENDPQVGMKLELYSERKSPRLVMEFTRTAETLFRHWRNGIGATNKLKSIELDLSRTTATGHCPGTTPVLDLARLEDLVRNASLRTFRIDLRPDLRRHSHWPSVSELKAMFEPGMSDLGRRLVKWDSVTETSQLLQCIQDTVWRYEIKRA